MNDLVVIWTGKLQVLGTLLPPFHNMPSSKHSPEAAKVSK